MLLLRALDRVRSGATLEEVLYIPSPKALKRMSLGYDGLMADIYWTRAVQYFGTKHHVGASQYDLLAPLLNITTALDPRLIVAYQYGGNFLAPKPPNGAGMPHAAIDLVQFGIQHNPDDWHLYYQLGFIYYMELKDYEHAADAFARGSRVPNAHPFLKIMAGLMAERAGDINTARLMWTMSYQNTTDKAIKANAAAHLRAIQVDEDVTNLEGAVERYKEKVPGAFPPASAISPPLGCCAERRETRWAISTNLLPRAGSNCSPPWIFPSQKKAFRPDTFPTIIPSFCRATREVLTFTFSSLRRLLWRNVS